MSENGETYATGKNFTLPPALTAWTNSTSVQVVHPVTLIRTRHSLEEQAGQQDLRSLKVSQNAHPTALTF